MSRQNGTPTPWSLLQVEGDDVSSDEENNTGAATASTSSLTSPVLSPASKRARKRQVAARNKRLAKEAKEGTAQNGQAGNTSSKATSVQPSAQAATKPANGAKSEKPAPTASLPTLAQKIPQPKLDEPFMQSISSTLDSAASSVSSAAKETQEQAELALPTLSRKSTRNDDGASIADTEEEEEDVSLLVDGDSSSSSSSDGEGSVSALISEPGTPRQPMVDSDASKEASAAKEGTKKTASDALQSVVKSDAAPDAVSQAAKEAQSSDALAKDPGAQKDVQNYGTDHDPTKKWKAIMTRTTWTLIMIAMFIGIVCAGHVYLIILVIALQAAVFKEISALFDVAAKPVHHHHHSRHNSVSAESKPKSPTRQARDARVKAERERWSKVTSWYFFAVSNYFLHGETIIYYFKHIVFVDAYFIPFARHHRFIAFMLYVLGFVGFVTNLKRNQLRRQFGLFCWIHMSLLLVVFSSHFIVNNILEGIIWFWVPASLVITNDIFAYIWGMLFGRTQLIKLSPKKTVEGFVGAAFTTVLFGYLWATVFMRYPYMICPATDLGKNAFSQIQCNVNSCFEWKAYVLPEHVSTVLSALTNLRITRIPYAPFQLHAVIMAIFASLVAPFGGFFASGFKRAFNIKDFGDSIPGHGGMTDRMDCQFMMGLFAYVYYSSIVRDNHVTVGSVMQTVVSSLSTQEQIELAKALHGYLSQQGVRWK